MDNLPDAIPEQLVLNGINARADKFTYDLTLNTDELVDIFLHGETRLPTGEHKKLLKDLKAEIDFAIESGSFDLEFGREANSIADAGWGLVFPSQTELNVPATKEALSDLIGLRKDDAGDLFHIYEGEDGFHPDDTATSFMTRHKSSRGTVHPRPDNLPYYLLLVGSPQEIPFYAQYELDATYLVGRIYFGKDPNLYYQYARSVFKAEKEGLKLPRRAVFFGTHHDGDAATAASSEMLVKTLPDDLQPKLNGKQKTWDLQYLDPAQCKRDRLETLLGRGDPALGFPKGDAPAFLFTATHGMVFPNGDKEQASLQGALLCQDLPSKDSPLAREDYLGAEDITDDFNLHGLIAFHFACFGAGTPMLDNFSKPGQGANKIAPADFLSALPQKLLTHPRGGALAVVGHIDRAWTYSFKWKEAGQQTQTFVDTLHRLMKGNRLGNAFDQFNQRYAQLAVTVSNWYDAAQVRPPTTEDLLRDWTANNDARGFVVLGDPAVKLATADTSETETERAGLPTELFTPKSSGAGGGESFTAAAAPPAHVESESPPKKDTGGAAPPQGAGAQTMVPGAPVVIYNQQGGVINVSAALRRAAQPGQAGQAESDFTFPLFGSKAQGGGEEAPAKAPDELANARSKLAAFMENLGDRLNDLTSLEVSTFVSSDLAKVEPQNGKLTGPDLQPRAKTLMHLNGDTEIVVPTDEAGGIDRDLWEIHLQTFEQAQAWREALVKAVANLVTSFIPGK
jgi:hypothetical protein